MASRLDPATEAAIQRAATRTGVDPATLRAFVLIESGGNPFNKTGSYKGLLQLSDREFANYGGQGNIFDPDANLTAGAAKLKAEAADFEKRFGRQPTASELYLMHQQGVGGSAMHWQNPERLAWQNMLDTAEGQQKGPAWAKAAIWGNVPDDLKRQFGTVDNLTSRDFVKLWDQKVARFSGEPVDVKETPAPTTSPAPQIEPVAPALPQPPTQQPSTKSSPAALPMLASVLGVNVPGPGTSLPAPDATSPAPSFTTSGLQIGPLSLGGITDTKSDGKEAELQTPVPAQLDLRGKPLDMQRLLTVLNNRSRLGLT